MALTNLTIHVSRFSLIPILTIHVSLLHHLSLTTSFLFSASDCRRRRAHDAGQPLAETSTVALRTEIPAVSRGDRERAEFGEIPAISSNWISSVSRNSLEHGDDHGEELTRASTRSLPLAPSFLKVSTENNHKFYGG
ncbi:hypothetical protein Dimus_020181 [Dionaea muscipula]